MTRCLSPVPACTRYPTAASQRPAGRARSGTRSSARAAPPSPATPQLLRMVLEEAKPSRAAGERFATLRLAQLRTPLAALFWSKKGSIAPRPHCQKSLTVKPQRAAASQPSPLAATPLPGRSLVTLPEPEGTGNAPNGDPN